MGRFGNVMLINGETEFSGQAARGRGRAPVSGQHREHADLQLRRPRRAEKLVGGDSGRYERETFVEEVLLAPSERAVVDVLFDSPGEVRLEHRTPDHVYDLGGVHRSPTARPARPPASFEVLRTDPELTAEHQSIGHDLEREPDKVLAFFS